MACIHFRIPEPILTASHEAAREVVPITDLDQYAFPVCAYSPMFEPEVPQAAALGAFPTNRLENTEMTRFILMTSAAIMLSSAAMAQTSTEAEATAAGTIYGVTWSDGVRAAIYDDFDMRVMRTADEARPIWLTLPEEDRNLVLADCEMIRVATDDDMVAGDTTTTETGIEGIANAVGLNNTDMVNVCTLVAVF
jgi:hypothetical protein